MSESLDRDIENAAALIYRVAQRYSDEGKRAPWMDDGNSDVQTDCRQAARLIVERHRSTGVSWTQPYAWELVRDGAPVRGFNPCFTLPPHWADIERAWDATYEPIYRAAVPTVGMITDAMIEAGAAALYTRKYGQMGGRWECVETKDVWHTQARAVLTAALGAPTEAA